MKAPDLAFGLITAWCLTATPSRAAPVIVDNQEVTSAKEHFRKGTVLYDTGRYLEAAKEYEQAFEAANRPELLFNVAQAYRQGGDVTRALAAYRGFIRRAPDNPQRSVADEHLATLEEMQRKEQERARSQPAPQITQPVLVMNAIPTKSPRLPIYKRWWVWTLVAGAAAGVAVGVGVGVTQSSGKSWTMLTPGAITK